MALSRYGMPSQTSRFVVCLFLARAKQLPLSVLLANDIRLANKLVPHMDRIRSLELTGYQDLYRLDVLQRPAPTLEYLLLASPLRNRPVQFAMLFSGNAPNLRALALLNPPALPKQPFAVLTDLHIGAWRQPPLRDFLALLAHAPTLRSLAIVNFNPMVHTWIVPAQQQGADIPLLHLRRLALVHASFIAGMALLSHLAIPPDAAVHILQLFSDGNIEPQATPLPQLAPIAAATTLEMVVCGDTLSFHMADDLGCSQAPRARCNAPRDRYSYGWWKELWRTLPCAHLTTLRIALDPEDDAFLPPFLDAAIGLTTLELRLHPCSRGSVSEHVRGVLDGAPPALLGVCALLEQELPVVCPCLAELALIDGSSTSCAWDGFLSGEETAPRVAYVPDLLCVVAARVVAGRALRRVAIQGWWRCAQRERVSGAFAMGAMVTNFEFREMDGDAPLLFGFEDDSGEEEWVNGYWRYELPKSTLPWDAQSNSSN